VTLCASRVQNGVVATVCLVTASDACFTEANKLKSVLVHHRCQSFHVSRVSEGQNSPCAQPHGTSKVEHAEFGTLNESAEPDICLEPLRDGVYVPGVKRALEGCAVVLVLRRESGDETLVFFLYCTVS